MFRGYRTKISAVLGVAASVGVHFWGVPQEVVGGLLAAGLWFLRDADRG